MRFALQDPHLDKLRDEAAPVTVVLTNGVKLYGCIASFDQFAVMVQGDVPQMVYKRAISYIQIARPDARQRPHTRHSSPGAGAPRSAPPYASEHAATSTHAKEPVIIVRKKHRLIIPGADKQ